jgi:hypothetical protein
MDDVSGPAVARGWFKSSRSNGCAACVEVRIELPMISIRDSKYRRDPHNPSAQEPTITFEAGHWAPFLSEATGTCPIIESRGVIIKRAADGTTSLVSVADGTTLVFTSEEWAAFVEGVVAGEFDVPELSLV